MKDFKRNTLRLLIIFFITYLFVQLIMSFKQENSINKLKKSVKLVNTKLVLLEENNLNVPVYGKLEAVEQVDIVSEVNGLFNGKKFKSGIKFSAGDTLGFINYDELNNNLNSQKSILLNQVAKLVSDIKFDYPDEYSIWYDFMKDISFQSNLPALPNIKSEKLRNYLSGKNFYSSYFSTKSIEDRIKKHVLIANFDGVLSDVNIKAGTAVIYGQKIGVYSNTNKLEFESSASLENALLIKPKMKVNIKTDELNEDVVGYVNRVNKTINNNSQNMSVFIELPGNIFFKGMYVYGHIIIGKEQNSLLVDRSLLDGDEIYLVVNNKLVKKKIKILQVIESKVIIKGLENNDLILSESIKDAYNGMEVRTK